MQTYIEDSFVNIFWPQVRQSKNILIIIFLNIHRLFKRLHFIKNIIFKLFNQQIVVLLIFIRYYSCFILKS